MSEKYPQYKIVEMFDMSPESLARETFRVLYQVQIRRWETGMVKNHDGTGPLYYNTSDGVPMRIGGPGQWMNCMDSNGPLLYSSRDEAVCKVDELKKSGGV